MVKGSSSNLLAGSLAGRLGARIAETEIKRFPDRECYVRIKENLDGEDVLLLQNAYPDENIIELVLLQDAIQEFAFNKLITVVPYFGYARQDKKFNDGESVSARSIAKIVQLYSDRIITIDLHSPKVIEWFDVPAENISGMPAIGNHLRDLSIDIVIAPDEGAKERAMSVAGIVGCEWDYLEKKRIDSETVDVKMKHLDVKDRNVVIVDDIISTGGTIVKATEHLKKEGVRKVYAACTHGLFVGNALEKLKVCDKVFSTDTIENERTEITVADEIAKAI